MPMSATSTTTMSPWEAEYDADLRHRMMELIDRWSTRGIDDVEKFVRAITATDDVGPSYDVSYRLAWDGQSLVKDCEYRRTAAAMAVWFDDPERDRTAQAVLDITMEHLRRMRDEAVTVATTGLFHEAVDRMKGRAALDIIRDLEWLPAYSRDQADRAISPDLWVARDAAYTAKRQAEMKRDNARSDRSRLSWQAVADSNARGIEELTEEIRHNAVMNGRPS